jgi:hypothetical protein
MRGSARPSKRGQEYLRSRLAAQRSLMAIGMSAEEADAWCDAWETEANRQKLRPGSEYFWDAGRGWIDAQRSFRRSSLARVG